MIVAKEAPLNLLKFVVLALAFGVAIISFQGLCGAGIIVASVSSCLLPLGATTQVREELGSTASQALEEGQASQTYRLEYAICRHTLRRAGLVTKRRRVPICDPD